MRTSPSKDDSPEDLVFFVKDNNYHQDTYKPFPHVFARTASDAGFGCVQKLPSCIGKKRKHAPLELHVKAYVNQFKISEYKCLQRDEDSVFNKKNYRNLEELFKSIGLVFPDSEYINTMCHGGNFLVKKKGMLFLVCHVVIRYKKDTLPSVRGRPLLHHHYLAYLCMFLVTQSALLLIEWSIWSTLSMDGCWSILLPNSGMCRFHSSKKISSLSSLLDDAIMDTNRCLMILLSTNLKPIRKIGAITISAP